MSSIKKNTHATPMVAPLPSTNIQEEVSIQTKTTIKEKSLARTNSFTSAGGEQKYLNSGDIAREIRPSDLIRSSVKAVAEKFEKYEGNNELEPPAYWNVNSPIDTEKKYGTTRSIEREYTDRGVATTRTTTSNSWGTSNTDEQRVGPSATPSNSKAGWTKPVSISVLQWWKGKNSGSGYMIRNKVTAEGSAGKAEAQSIIYAADHRYKLSVGGRISPAGAEGGASVKGRIVAAGAKFTSGVTSKSMKIAGQDLDVSANIMAQPMVVAEASSYVWGDIDVHNPKASISIGGGAFAGAKAYSHIDFGIGSVLNLRVTNELWAGIGADASAHVDVEKGKLSIGASMGSSLGIGAKVGFEVDLDLVAAGKLAKHAIDRDGDGKISLNDGAAGLAQGANLAATGIEKSTDGIIKALDADNDGKFSTFDLQMRLMQAGDEIKEGAKSTVKTLKEGASFIGDAIHDGADRNGDGKISLDDVSTGFREAGDAIAKAKNNIGRAGKVAAALGRGTLHDIKDATHNMGQSIHKAGKAVHRIADLNGDGSLSLRDLTFGGEKAAKVMAHLGREASDSLIEGSKDLAQGIKNAKHSIAQGFDNAIDSIQDGAKASGKAIHNAIDVDGDGSITANDAIAAFEQSGEAIAHGAEAIIDAGKAVGQGIASASHSVVDGSKQAFKAAKNSVTTAATTVSDGAKHAYARAGAAIGRLVDFFF